MTFTKDTVRHLYHGRDTRARAFRFAMIGFDLASIIFFVASSLMRDAPWIYVADALIALVVMADLALRIWITNRPARLFTQLTTWADIIVIVTLLLPTVIESYLFLRVLRALRLLRSYHMLGDLRQEFDFFRRNEEVIHSAINLLVFVFLMTALVYVAQVNTNPNINNYIDALYFTVTALTTTGFGDITLQGTGGGCCRSPSWCSGWDCSCGLSRPSFAPSASTTSARTAASPATSRMPCTASTAGASCTSGPRARASCGTPVDPWSYQQTCGGTFFSRRVRLYSSGRIRPAMAINGRRNKPIGPGGGTRRLHHQPEHAPRHPGVLAGRAADGGEIGSTKV